MIVQRRECRRTAKRLMYFLDRDPDAPLSETDKEQIRAHLEVCRKCASVAEEYAILHDELRALGESTEVPTASIRRIQEAVQRTLDEFGLNQ